MKRLLHSAFEPVSNSTLAVLRAAYGAVLAWHFGLTITTSVGYEQYQAPAVRLSYPGLEWMVRLEEPWMMVLIWTALVAAILTSVGLVFRVAAPVLVASLTYLHFHDLSVYSNFDYIAILVGFWLALSPANARFSLDARLFPGARSDVGPRWPLWMVRTQLSIAYFYGGLIKFNPDWLAGEPVRGWLTQSAPDTIFGPILATEPVIAFFVWAGLIFDLTIWIWLLVPTTRLPAVFATVAFHLTAEHVFQVGVLPFLMIALTIAFLPHDFFETYLPRTKVERPSGGVWHRRVMTVVAAVWIAWQALFPLRHLLYPGDGRWTFEGHAFSWWWRSARFDQRVKVWVVDASGRRIEHYPPDHIREHQQNIFLDPHALVQYAHWIDDSLYPDEDVEVHADVQSSLNGRPMQQFIPPEIDLSAQPITMRHYDWVVPLQPRPDE